MSPTDHDGILGSWEKEQQALVTVTGLVGNGIFLTLIHYSKLMLQQFTDLCLSFICGTPLSM